MQALCPDPMLYVTKTTIRVACAQAWRRALTAGIRVARCRTRALRNITAPVLSGDTGRDFIASGRLDKPTSPVPEAQCSRRLPYTILLTSLSALFAVQITLIVQAAGMSHPFRLAGALASAAAVFALQVGSSSASAERWRVRQR